MVSNPDVPLRLERDGAVAVVTLDRPQARNALDTALKSALRTALERLADDDAVRAVVLTGAGSAFCVGQDLAEHAQALRDDPGSALTTVDEHYGPIVEAIAALPKPVVAAVNGTCVGAGLGFALACDVRVFAAGATLGTAFTGIGLTCDSALSASLAADIGMGRARELVLLATPFTSEEALAWGVGGRVVEPAQVLPEALALAARLAAGPTLAYAASKRLLADAPGRDLAANLAAEGREQKALGLTADHQGAVAAFLEKRRPQFEGR